MFRGQLTGQQQLDLILGLLGLNFGEAVVGHQAVGRVADPVSEDDTDLLQVWQPRRSRATGSSSWPRWVWALPWKALECAGDTLVNALLDEFKCFKIDYRIMPVVTCLAVSSRRSLLLQSGRP